MMLRYCAKLKAIRYESTNLSKIVADKSHRVIAALVFINRMQGPYCELPERIKKRAAHSENFLGGQVCKGNLAFRLQQSTIVLSWTTLGTD